MNDAQFVTSEEMAAGEAPNIGTIYAGNGPNTVRKHMDDVQNLRRQAAKMEPGTRVAVSRLRISNEENGAPLQVTWRYQFLGPNDEPPYGWQTHDAY